jgi:hypothetical protein
LTQPLPFIHTLVLVGPGKRRYWFAPAEMGTDEPQAARLALPVDQDQKPFPTYQVEILRYGSNGRQETREVVTLKRDRRPGGLSLEIDSHKVRFRAPDDPPAVPSFPYKGKLIHPDFEYRLATLEPCDPGQLDRLFLENRLLILGCDPFAHYGGLNGPPPARKRGDRPDTALPVSDPDVPVSGSRRSGQG